MVILPVDQGFEHGPARSASRPTPTPTIRGTTSSSPSTRGLSAYAAPLGMIEAGADAFAGQIPTILKANSANSPDVAAPPARTRRSPRPSTTRCAWAARRSGSRSTPAPTWRWGMFEEIAELRREAAMAGIATVIWSYPRGEAVSKDGETAIDIAAYAAQIAALLGRARDQDQALDRPPGAQGGQGGLQGARSIDVSTQAARVAHCMQAAFGGRRIVVFSGGAKKGEDSASTRTRKRSTPAAATARSSGATRSSARAPRRWRCWRGSSTSIAS